MKIRCPDDYRQWLVSMFSLFGTKWVKLFCGPMFKVEATNQGDSTYTSPDLMDPLQVSGGCFGNHDVTTTKLRHG